MSIISGDCSVAARSSGNTTLRRRRRLNAGGSASQSGSSSPGSQSILSFTKWVSASAGGTSTVGRSVGGAWASCAVTVGPASGTVSSDPVVEPSVPVVESSNSDRSGSSRASNGSPNCSGTCCS